jgi:uncharacterized protein YaaR (DUF327 family)
LVREQKEFVDEDEINANTPPADVVKFISAQINEMGSVLKDDQIVKVVKRMKKMVSKFLADVCTVLVLCSTFDCLM